LTILFNKYKVKSSVITNVNENEEWN